MLPNLYFLSYLLQYLIPIPVGEIGGWEFKSHDFFDNLVRARAISVKASQSSKPYIVFGSKEP